MAAGGTTTSLGTGKMELSIAISTTTPQYPQSITHPIHMLISSCNIPDIMHSESFLASLINERRAPVGRGAEKNPGADGFD